MVATPVSHAGSSEVRFRKGRVVYEGMQLSLADSGVWAGRGWMERVSRCSVFIIPRDKGRFSYFWRHAFLTAKCGPELRGVINRDRGVSMETRRAGGAHGLTSTISRSTNSLNAHRAERLCSRHCGKRMAKRSSVWRRSNLSAGT